MTCEDTHRRLTWEIQVYEPSTRGWLPRCYGRATTTAPPDDLATTVLTAYLAITTTWPGQQFRATVTAHGGSRPSIVTADQLPAEPQAVRDDVLQALPLYLRDALKKPA